MMMMKATEMRYQDIKSVFLSDLVRNYNGMDTVPYLSSFSAAPPQRNLLRT